MELKVRVFVIFELSVPAIESSVKRNARQISHLE